MPSLKNNFQSAGDSGVVTKRSPPCRLCLSNGGSHAACGSLRRPASSHSPAAAYCVANGIQRPSPPGCRGSTAWRDPSASYLCALFKHRTKALSYHAIFQAAAIFISRQIAAMNVVRPARDSSSVTYMISCLMILIDMTLFQRVRTERSGKI